MLICCITAFDNLLMLTIFHVQNVLIIVDWCLCDFLLLKHIDEVDALHLHLSLTYFLCGKYSTISKLLLIIDWCWLFFMWKCSYHSWLMFMWFSCTERYWWSGWLHLHLSLTYFLCGNYSTISILLLIIY